MVYFHKENGMSPDLSPINGHGGMFPKYNSIMNLSIKYQIINLDHLLFHLYRTLFQLCNLSTPPSSSHLFRYSLTFRYLSTFSHSYREKISTKRQATNCCHSAHFGYKSQKTHSLNSTNHRLQTVRRVSCPIQNQLSTAIYAIRQINSQLDN